MIVRAEIPWCGRKQSEQMRKRVPYIGRHVVNPYQYFNVGISTNAQSFVNIEICSTGRFYTLKINCFFLRV